MCGSRPAKSKPGGLSSGYGTAEVLRGVSFRLEHGRVLGIIGRNGVGKTTLVKTIMGPDPGNEGVGQHPGPGCHPDEAPI